MLDFFGKVCGVAIVMSLMFLLIVVGCYALGFILDFMLASYVRLVVGIIFVIALCTVEYKKLID